MCFCALHWAQAAADLPLGAVLWWLQGEPLPTEVTGSTAAVTRSKVSKPTAVTTPELPASEHASDSSSMEVHSMMLNKLSSKSDGTHLERGTVSLAEAATQL